MKTTKYFLVINIITLMLLFCGCKKNWFDIKSDKSLSVPSSMQDFEYLLDHTLLYGNVPGLGELGSDGHYMPDTRFQTLPNTGNLGVQKNAYTWTNNFRYAVVTDWNDCYIRIYTCNLVLDGLKEIEPRNVLGTEQYNRLKGTALFHRAKAYFDLSQVYAQPYNRSTATTDIGIPLKEGLDVTEPAKRATVHQVYEQIINDLLTAAELLPNLAQYPTRGSKTATFALLARIYLVMGDYTKAGNYADLCLKNYNTLMDFNTIPSTATNLGKFNVETIFYSTMALHSFIFTDGFVYVDPILYNLFDNNDLRKTRFFNNTINGIVFKGVYSNSLLPFTGLATDEVYLIRAECYARAGNTTAAMKDLNDLLRKRWNNTVTFPPVTAATADEALFKILLERKKELLFRGLRWSDLKRLNQEDRFKETLTRTVAGVTYTLEPNSYKYTLPIPDDVMELAPLMKQSPGW